MDRAESRRSQARILSLPLAFTPQFWDRAGNAIARLHCSSPSLPLSIERALVLMVGVLRRGNQVPSAQSSLLRGCRPAQWHPSARYHQGQFHRPRRFRLAKHT